MKIPLLDPPPGAARGRKEVGAPSAMFAETLDAVCGEGERLETKKWTRA
jgi:hypothetical protein